MAYYYPAIDCALTSYAEEKNLTMAQLAGRLGLSRATYYSRKKGITAWTVDELRIIASMTCRMCEDLLSERRMVV